MGLLTFPSLAGIPDLLHGISSRAVPRAAIAEHLGVDRPVLTPTQVHGATIRALDEATYDTSDGAEAALQGSFDGWSSDAAGGPILGVLGADCPGVLIVAPASHAFVLLHAGWRGVVAGIVPAGLHLLAARYGASVSDLHVAIGPGISGPNYEVSAEVADAIGESVRASDRDAVLTPGQPGHAYADLRAAIRAQLNQRGVADARIETHAACTFDDARFYSYRGDGPEAGRHLLVACWR